MSGDDRELLVLAARAAGIELDWDVPEGGSPWTITGETAEERSPGSPWNPLRDDGDAFRLAVKLGIHVGPNPSIEKVIAYSVDHIAEELNGDDKCAALRRAVVRVAAEPGRKLP